jgi:hypothetical protein
LAPCRDRLWLNSVSGQAMVVAVSQPVNAALTRRGKALRYSALSTSQNSGAAPLIVAYLLIGTFVCLFPLMLYCLFLVGLNNRPRPTLVPGSWDFAMVLLATAGFWMIGGPVVLAGFQEQTQQILLRGSFATIRDHLHVKIWPWGLLWAGYFLLFVAGSAWLLRRRRAVSVVYHVEPASAYTAVESALAGCGWSWTRHGTEYVVEGKGRAVLEIAVAPLLRTVALRWPPGGEGFHDAFAAELTGVLAEHVSGESPVAGWMLTVAIALFVLMVCCVVLFVFFMISLHR